MNTALDLAAIRAAHERIRPHIHRTPVLTSARLDSASGASLLFKCENFQKVGAFKARGAANAVFMLDDATAKLFALAVGLTEVRVVSILEDQPGAAE